ncbi:PREDICTED: sialin-like [Nicrophorus vespilloides]|uniref:Sialin-like n=1 Tax=Nicrophorus vespilloides TaxID=110193 RepID=A0ABM1MBV0_NICVS|nr:PREDICTED: sialin-like [Nicrophorus vespilloides]
MGNEKEKTQISIPKNKQWMATRDVLWYLVFFGFAVNYMIRINLNIAIVSMVQARPKSNISSVECFTELSLNESSINGTESVEQMQEPADETKFEWNEKQQGLILGAFFWLHWATQVPGGILAAKYGTKMIFGVSNFVGVLFCFIMPWASYMGPEYLIFLRVVQGIITGFAWPAMHHMTARWIPPNERSKFVTAYLGSSVGAGITFPVCGYIISRWGWEVVFHVCGVAGCVWYTAWYFLVFDSPAEHPRISDEEREYIVRSLGRSISKEKF